MSMGTFSHDVEHMLVEEIKNIVIEGRSSQMRHVLYPLQLEDSRATRIIS